MTFAAQQTASPWTDPATGTRPVDRYCADPCTDPRDELFARIAGGLAAHFTPDLDANALLTVTMRAVAAYQPQTQAELLGATRIVSLSLTALDLLRDAARPDMAPELKLQYIRTSVSVERAACQAERLLEKRRALRQKTADTGPSVRRDRAIREATGLDANALEAQIQAARERPIAEQTFYRADYAVAEQTPAEPPRQTVADNNAETQSPMRGPDASTPPPPVPHTPLHDRARGARPAAHSAATPANGSSDIGIDSLSPAAFADMVIAENGLSLLLAETGQQHDQRVRAAHIAGNIGRPAGGLPNGVHATG